ncbi:hypothetical protein [Legionella pneumophila]|uniref:hypothetical protein n=1 Tax=Legionella pneumophila TaxID=446 RepID=UPI000490AFF0|nr:hypothetical protein [Legionella pneumophila]RYB35169.1 hypothetical protein D7242_11030 [Legionella pneumophila]RYW28048.1 hypothetical protein D7234_06905 [Legionella pneumophila]HAT1868641.1 hypothetical protein [Legionella pneumophila]HAT1908766.1 hypothetical protein [Legionella pneumophila]HAT1917886.1 hypothetical protein [Legionella pneumophila]
MIDEKNYFLEIDFARQRVIDLPAGEFKYYLYILLESIKSQNVPSRHEFLAVLLKLLDTLHKLKELKTPNFLDNQCPSSQLLKELVLHFSELQRVAKTHHFTAQVMIILLHISGIISALALGVVGGLLGGIMGFVNGLCEYKPVIGFLVGTFTGTVLGGLFGFRAPKKLFKNEVQRQIKFGLDGLGESLDNIKQEYSFCMFSRNKMKPFSFYLGEAESEIKQLFNDDSEYEEFLNHKVDYEINSFLASFIGESLLHGCVGHHAYIKITIKNREYLIEFTPQPTDTKEIPAQSEMRTVSGKKIVEMRAYHKKLQETNAPTASFILTKMKPGDNDCFSYVNKILIGTNQQGATIKRFANMGFIGSLLGMGIEALSPFKPDFFQITNSVRTNKEKMPGYSNDLSMNSLLPQLKHG